MIRSSTPLNDPRLRGAAFALALDLALVFVSAVLVLQSITAATGVVLASVGGIGIAPALGWRYGASAAKGSPGWQYDAVRTLVRLDLVLVGLFVAVDVIAVPVQDGLAARLLLATYAGLMGGLVAAVFSVGLVVPLGWMWTRLMGWSSQDH